MNVKVLVEIVIDGKMPDGSSASAELIEQALLICRGEDPELHAVMVVARHGIDVSTGNTVGWDERAAALEQIERRAASAWEIPVSPEWTGMAESLYSEEDASGTRESRRALTREGLALRGIQAHGGNRPLRRPRSTRRRVGDIDVASLLDDAAREAGFEPAELYRAIPRGRPSAADQSRREVLAMVVRRAKLAGARLEQIGAVIGRSKQRVAELDAQGRRESEG